MDEAMKARVEATLKNLKRNRMEAYYVDTKEQACDLVKTLVQPGATVSCGGSVTLKQTGVYDIIASGDYDFLDRSACKTAEETDALYRQVFSADAFFTSANAVTENGELYNVDGNSNRVAALLYGAKSVVIVAGINKLVKDLDEAVLRVKTIAAPKNAKRLSCDTPCAKLGHCISLAKNGGMTNGCKTPGRICANFTVMAYQRHVSRVKVIIVGETLGY